jgi:preprotein translocase subunit SecF
MRSGLATRLYRGEAAVNVVGRRRLWFSIAGGIVLFALLSFIVRGFVLGIDFKGGTEFQVPASAGSRATVEATLERDGANVVTAQTIGNGRNASYLIRTSPLSTTEQTQIKQEVAKDLNLAPEEISDNRVSSAWGAQVTVKALEALAIFLVLVVGYLIIRFELRMAIAAVCSLLLDLMLTAGVYSLVGFEVTPSTIIGFLTILGFALYDVVVVFDKVQENTKNITGSNNQTYEEAANLAVNQTLMRSINTGLVALLPVGGLLFIGAGLLQAGTLKDLGLVLFFGMGAAVYSSIFFATPVLVELKSREPRFQAHTQRVLARRAGTSRAGAKAAGTGDETPAARPAKGKPAPTKRAATAQTGTADDSTELAAIAGSAPRPGSRPSGRPGQSGRSGQAKRGGGGRGGRPSGKRR